MTTPLKISAKIELDATQTSQGAATANAAVASIGSAADQTTAKLQKMQAASAGPGTPAGAGAGTTANQNGGRPNTAPITAEGKALDDLRAKYSPLYATVRAYKTEVASIKAANAAGALSMNEMTAAIQRQRQATLLSIDALKGRAAAIRASAANGASAGQQRAVATSLAAQGQDIFVSALGGMSSGTIGFQQGTQISGALQQLGSGKEMLKGLATAAVSLVSPVSIAAIGLTAAAAAAIHFGMEAFTSVNTVTDALEKHDATLKNIKARYDEAALSGEQFGQRAQQAISFEANQDRLNLQKVRDNGVSSFVSQASSFDRSQYEFPGADMAGISEQVTKDKFGPFAAIVSEFIDKARTGKADVLTLNEQVRNLANSNPTDKGLQSVAKNILLMTGDATKAAEALKELNVQQTALSSRASRGVIINSAADDARRAYLDQSDIVRELNARQAASQASLFAKSPAEKAAAARAAAAMDRVDTDNPDTRATRIAMAGKDALIRAEKELKDAQTERTRALQNSIDDQQFELFLIGKTVGEQERLRMEHRLLAELRAEAARNGTEIDKTEIENIQKKTAEYGRLREAFNAYSTGVTSRGAVINSPADDDRRAYLDQSGTVREMQERQAASQASLFAKSAAEKAAAARVAAALQVDTNENPTTRAARIELAGKDALIRAEKELADAQRERGRALESSMAQQQLELSLIGKTVGEQERLRMEFQLIAELKAEAARSGTTVDEAEIARIKEKAAAYGKVAEQIAAQKALLGQDQEVADLRTRISLAGESEQVRSRGINALETENRIRDLGLAKGSAEAEQYRQKAALIADQTSQLKRQEEAWSQVRGTAEGTIDSIVDKFSEGDFKGGLDDIAKDWKKTILELGVTNPLKNGLLGTSKGTFADIGGIGRMFSKLLGGGDSSVASMSVSAGTVMVNGGVTGGAAGLAGSLLGANENAVTGGLGAATTNQTGVAAQAWNFFAGKGLKPHQIAGILGNMGAESAFNPLAVGDGGAALGLFQHNDRAPNLLSAIGGRGNLGNVSGQLDFAWKELQTTESASLKKLLASTDVRGATAAFGGFERPQGYSAANPEGMHNWSGRLSGAEQALTKFGNTTAGATQNLGTFGGGLGQLGQSLSTFPAAPAASGGGGGIGGWLSGLFKTAFVPNGAQATLAASGTKFGLYANGGISDKPAIFGEGPMAEAAVPLPNGRSIPVNLNVRQGYGRRDGGSSQPAPAAIFKTEVHNYSSAKVETEETTDERGGRQQKFIISDAVGSGISQKGGGGQKALTGQFGVKRKGIRR